MSERAKTIFRVEKNADNPFVMIDRRVIENPKLSWKAKGLLAYLLSRPDNWVVRFADLAKRAPDGAHTIRAAMKELRKAGHVQVITEREDGRVKQWVYKVYEVPLLSDFQQVEKQQVEKRALNKNKRATKKNSKDIKEGASAKPKASDFPELVVYRDVVKHWPKPFQHEAVIGAIQKINNRLGRGATTEDLHPFFSAWGKVSGNEWSLAWLEWAETGQVPVNGTWKSQRQTETDGEKIDRILGVTR